MSLLILLKQRSVMRKLALYFLWVMVALILMSISNYFLNLSVYKQNYSITSILLSNLGLVGLGFLISAIVKSLKSKWLTSLVVILFFLTIFISISEILIYKYSGVAFVKQSFLHFEIESLFVGFAIYPVEYSSVVLTILIISLVLYWLAIPIQTSKKIYVILVILFFLVVNHNFGSSLGRLITNYKAYKNQKEIEMLSAQAIQPYEEFGIQPISANNQMLKAEFVGRKKNLIIIYQESFSRGFISSDKYPGLTPEIDQLIQTNGAFENYHSTAKFTIQGLISSLCGFIPNLASGNNISSNQIPYINLPCLSDILKKLEYQQEFVGGSRKNFSNREAILKTKGFDKVWGWLDYEKPKGYQKNDWGLQDSDLYDFALNRAIEMNKKEKPFHLSLLTLATHLDGNPDPICPEYRPEEKHHKFINGIHCADFLLGRFINQLKEHGLLKNTTVLITSDHGVFPVKLINNLYGKSFDKNRLLGILIDDYNFDKSLPLALYDVSSIVLKALNIEFNSGFINGRTPDKINKDRFILRENLLNKKDKFAEGCNQTEKISIPIDLCENQRLVDKTWGYAAGFNKEFEQYKLSDGVSFSSSIQNNKRKTEFYLGGVAQTQNFIVNGYPLSDANRNSRNHIFVLVYDLATQSVDSYNAYRYIDTNVDYFYRLVFLEEKQEDKIYFIFSELGTKADSNEKWNQIFKALGSDKFNFPQEPYFGIFKKSNNVLSKAEWSVSPVKSLNLDFGDLSQVNFTDLVND